MESANPMPKHNPFVVEEVIAQPRERVEFVKLTLLIDANVTVQGSVSGKSYVFFGAGSIADVDKRDVDALLQKRQGGRQCCGGTEFGNRVFEIVLEK